MVTLNTSPAPIPRMSIADMRAELRLDARDGGRRRLVPSPLPGAPGQFVTPPVATDDRLGLATALSMQRAAQLVARRSGIPATLAKVVVRDADVDADGANALTHQRSTTPWTQLSARLSADLEDGIRRLSAGEAMSTWKPSDQVRFAEAGRILAHEAAHATLPAPPAGGHVIQSDALEEGLSEIVALARYRELLQVAFGIDRVPPRVGRVVANSGGYARFTEPLRRLLGEAGFSSGRDVLAMAHRLGDTIAPPDRMRELARTIAGGAGGDGVPQEVVVELERSIPGYLEDRIPAQRVRMQALLGALADHRSGAGIDLPALRTRLAAIDRTIPPAADGQP